MSAGTAPRRLIIFAKYPRAGEVKTRLVPPLTFDEAADLAGAFLADTLATARAAATLAGANVELRVASEAEVEPMRALLLATMPDANTVEAGAPMIRAQRGNGLGERLHAATEAALREGCAQVCVVGSDHPTLPAAYLVDAFARLGRADLVLGPAEDGGYYLVGLRRAIPEIFALGCFSTPRLLEETLAAAQGLGYATELLPPWYDVDDAADLERLAADRALLPAGSRTAALLDERSTASGMGRLRDGGAESGEAKHTA